MSDFPDRLREVLSSDDMNEPAPEWRQSRSDPEDPTRQERSYPGPVGWTVWAEINNLNYSGNAPDDADWQWMADAYDDEDHEPRFARGAPYGSAASEEDAKRQAEEAAQLVLGYLQDSPEDDE